MTDRAACRDADEAMPAQAFQFDAEWSIGHVLFAVEQDQFSVAKQAAYRAVEEWLAAKLP